MVLMKKLLKKNQIMITALAIMIAVAGYLNFAGAKIGEEDFLSTNGSDSELTYDVADISDEDIIYFSICYVCDIPTGGTRWFFNRYHQHGYR